MESIRILQNTYENLYVLQQPICNFLKNRLPLIPPNWRHLVDEILETRLGYNNHTYFENLDVYYLLTILLSEKVWNPLKELLFDERNFFTNENYKLLKDVKEIRNKISHPTFEIYTKNDYDFWTTRIETAARLFCTELSKLKTELYNSEKESILNFILSKVINPALTNPNIPEKIKISVQDTKKRLELQNTAQGIIYFFQDSLNSLRGKEIKDEFHKNNLLAFEDIKTEVENLYFF